MNFLPLRPSLCLALAVAVAACGGGGGGGSSGSTGTSGATLSGSLRVPAVAPLRLTSYDVQRPMRGGEVVVWLDPGRDAAELAFDGFELVRAGGAIAVYRAHAAAGKASVRHGAAADDCVESATFEAAATMQARTGVRCAEPNFLLHHHGMRARKSSVSPPGLPALVPNDPAYPLQWHYDQINLAQAWAITQGSANVIVAVLDGGILGAHPDFDPARNVSGYDMVSDVAAALDGDGQDGDPEDPGDQQSPQGSSFHGTHVAGTIGASTNNGGGVAGVDWNCRLMHVRVLGLGGGGSLADIADGILYAAGLPNSSGQVPAQRADIINMSLGAPGVLPVLENACNAAAAAGCVLIAAAGNENTSELSSPDAFESVISVGATDLVGQRAPYSNFQTTVDVWAPGGDSTADRNGDQYPDEVLSTRAVDRPTFAFNVDFLEGTSMAAPHVAGVAALLKAVNPSLTAAEIRAFLTSSATTQPGNGLPNGGRLVDALLAVQAAGGTFNGPLLVVSPNVVDFGADETQITVAIANRGTGSLTFTGAVADPDVPWLQGDVSDATPANGLDIDSLALAIDRTGLPNGSLQTVITLSYLDGSTPLTIDIPVRVQVGAPTLPSDEVIVLLVDPASQETRAQTTTSRDANFGFALTGVAAGSYLLVAGTDRDDDGLLGDAGELFGIWPSIDSPRPIEVAANSSLTNLEFSTQNNVTVQSAGRAASWSFRRLR
jgi:serine protease